MPILRAQTRQRREKLRDLTRQEILVAAARAFAGGGFETVTMQDLAAAAGFSAASLYTYYPSKDAIYAALLEHVSAALDQPLDLPVDRKSPFPQRLELLLALQLKVMAQNLDTFLLMMQPTSSRGPADVQKRAREAGLPRSIARLERWLEQNSTARERGKVPPRRLALAVFGVGQSFVMERLMQRTTAGFDDLARAIVDQTLYGVLGKPS